MLMGLQKRYIYIKKCQVGSDVHLNAKDHAFPKNNKNFLYIPRLFIDIICQLHVLMYKYF